MAGGAPEVALPGPPELLEPLLAARVRAAAVALQGERLLPARLRLVALRAARPELLEPRLGRRDPGTTASLSAPRATWGRTGEAKMWA